MGSDQKDLGYGYFQEERKPVLSDLPLEAKTSFQHLYFDNNQYLRTKSGTRLMPNYFLHNQVAIPTDCQKHPSFQLQLTKTKK